MHLFLTIIRALALTLSLLAHSLLAYPAVAKSTTTPAFDTRAQYALLMDADTGAVLLQKNADLATPPLLHEQINDGIFGL